MFFEFHQNNSGGFWKTNADVRKYVIVEAKDWQEANERAEMKGLYFDGSGDCSCCGARWYEQSEGEEGTVVPTLYGNEVELGKEDSEVVIHYLDGTRKYAVKGSY